MKRLITGVGKVELPISNESGGSQFGILNPQERSEIICVLAVDLSLRSPGFA